MNTLVDGILTIVFNIFEFVFNLLFGWINLPAVPTSLQNTVNTYLNYIFNNLDLLSFFVRVSTLQTIFKLFIIVYIFKYTFKLIMFILHKVPDMISAWTNLNIFK